MPEVVVGRWVTPGMNPGTIPHKSCACGAFDLWGPQDDDATSGPEVVVGRWLTPGMNPGFLSTLMPR
jgi:hypothetical protein